MLHTIQFLMNKNDIMLMIRVEHHCIDCIEVGTPGLTTASINCDMQIELLVINH